MGKLQVQSRVHQIKGFAIGRIKALAKGLVKSLSPNNLFRGNVLGPNFSRRLEVVAAITPGIFFIVLGLSILLAPQLLPLLLSAFCISFGLICCFFSLRFLQLKRKLSRFSHQIEARFIIDPGKVSDSSTQREQNESKKVVYH